MGDICCLSANVHADRQWCVFRICKYAGIPRTPPVKTHQNTPRAVKATLQPARRTHTAVSACFQSSRELPPKCDSWCRHHTVRSLHGLKMNIRITTVFDTADRESAPTPTRLEAHRPPSILRPGSARLGHSHEMRLRLRHAEADPQTQSQLPTQSPAMSYSSATSRMTHASAVTPR